jgi:hypothetical protein
MHRGFQVGRRALLVALFAIACADGEQGTLAGTVSIGPLSPVQQSGEPEPTPAPANCRSVRLAVARSGGGPVRVIEVAGDCTFRARLPAGPYVVNLEESGITFSKDLPLRVRV